MRRFLLYVHPDAETADGVRRAGLDAGHGQENGEQRKIYLM